jgi:hypothetical protein
MVPTTSNAWPVSASLALLIDTRFDLAILQFPFPMLAISIPVLTRSCVVSQNCSNYTRSARQELCLGSGKLFIGEYACAVQLGKLIELGCQIILGRRLRRWCILWWGRRRILRLLLCLCIGSALLVGLVVLRLGSRILLGILLLLVVTDRTGRTGDDCRGDRGPGYGSSTHSSSHHLDLFSLLM